MRAVIMAGGKGTRLAALTKNEIPKALYELDGKPIIVHQLEQFRRYNITEATIVIGNLGDQIREYLGDGSKLGMNIDYIEEKEPLGTAGSFYYLKDNLKKHGDEEFIMTMGDLYFDFNMNRLMDFHHAVNAFVTLIVHPNMHPFDSDLVLTDKTGRVTGFDSKHNVRDYWYDNCVNAGVFIMNSRICDYVTEPKKISLEKDLISSIIDKERVFAYHTPEFIRDVGTVDRVEKTLEDIRSGIVEARNLENKQRAIFLDRDGVINKGNGFIHTPEMLELFEFTPEAIRKINSSGYLAILITNQPSIARGLCTFEDLDGIFNKMKTLLGKEGAYLDAIYFCPHHPDKGYEGEVPELKIDCNCRKPKTGMVDAAAIVYNIDLSKSFMIGDRTADIEMGRRAGITTIGVRTGDGLKDGRYEVSPDHVSDNILTAVELAIGLQPRTEE